MVAKKPKAKVYVFEARDARKARLLGMPVSKYQDRITELRRQVEEVKRSGKSTA